MSSLAFAYQPPTIVEVEPDTVTRVCDPCVKFDEQTEATATIRFVINGEWHTMDVCPGHEQMWLQQFDDWAEVATKLARQPSTLTHELAATDRDLYRSLGDKEVRHRLLPEQPDPRRVRVVLPEPVIKTDVVINRDEPDYSVPAAGEIPLKIIREWGITEHARQRMEERFITIQEVWRTLQHRGIAHNKPGSEPGTVVITLGDVVVVVDDQAKVVVTVYRPYDSEAAAATAALGGRF